jgi:hypothetical protein
LCTPRAEIVVRAKRDGKLLALGCIPPEPETPELPERPVIERGRSADEQETVVVVGDPFGKDGCRRLPAPVTLAEIAKGSRCESTRGSFEGQVAERN